MRVACVAPATLLLGLALAACGAAANGGAPTGRTSTTAAAKASAAATPASAAAKGAAATGAQQPCATAGQVAASTASLVARRIYQLELNSSEVRADRAQIEGFAPLLSALASGNRAAVGEAVTSLVFSHTHVVRLRVTSGAGVLADVGGPFILAPVEGSLRTQGRTIGHYVFSVQDDSGYSRLEQRFVGAPMLIRREGRRLPVETTLPADAASLPTSGRGSYRGGSYQVVTFPVRAMPSGSLSISLLVAAPTRSPLSCHAVATAELARIGEHTWRRFSTVGAPPSAFVHSLGSLTGALAYVRAGSQQIAGSSAPGPAHLPLTGTVRYHGRNYTVSSFPALLAGQPARVYQLLPA
jgi:hypothetical protein